MGSDLSGPPVFALDVTVDDGGWSTIAVAGELDVATADAFMHAVREGLAAGPVAIDLRSLVFMDSTGVRAMNTTLRESAAQGRQLRVFREMSPNVAQVLEMTGMLALLPLEEER